MWMDGANEFIDLFKNSFPYSFLFFIPILIIISPVSPASAAHEFSVFRMQQYDLQGSSYGCRSALVNVEARALDAKVYTRRCVVAPLNDLQLDRYREIATQGGGALLVLLPRDLTSLTAEQRQHLLELEQDLMQEDTQLPVFFTPETDDLLAIYDDVKTSVNSDQAASAVEALLSSASANGFQMVVTGSQSKAIGDFQMVNIQGKLSGSGIEEQLPTIAIVAHYDAYGIAPSLALGADSNGSGVAALLELARLFSKLYTNSRTHAKFNLLFLLSGGGKFNYQGTKRWIEDHLDSSENSLLTDVAFVLCLDALGSDGLRLHVSKPPKAGSAGDSLLQKLERVSSKMAVPFEMVHKKINLADDLLAWEHERFSIRRLPAFTVSSLNSHKMLIRNSILDVRQTVDNSSFVKNVQVVCEALAQHVFGIETEADMQIFTDSLHVEQALLTSWLDYLSSQPRSAQLINKQSPLLATLEQAMARSLKDARRHTFKADKRDPEYMFYSGAEYTMNAYKVKPAVFDLFLGLAIALYLGCTYLLVQNFGTIRVMFKALSAPNKMKKT